MFVVLKKNISYVLVKMGCILFRPPDKSVYWKIIFYFSSKTYIMGTPKNRVNETFF